MLMLRLAVGALLAADLSTCTCLFCTYLALPVFSSVCFPLHTDWRAEVALFS